MFLPVAPAGLFGGWCRRMHRFSLSACGFPHPRAGRFLLVQKVPKNTPAPFGLDPRFCPIGRSQVRTAQPLKRRFLASDLRRVSCPTSAVALLKGQANLGFYVSLAASVETPQSLANPKRNNHRHEGRQAKFVTHRTDYEGAGGPAEIQWQPGIKFTPDRLDKQRGSGVSPAPFGDFCAYKSHPGSGGGTPAGEHLGPESGSPGNHSSEAGPPEASWLRVKSKKSRRKIPHSVQNKSKNENISTRRKT